eukprot:TRINITY_DN48278_c0_g1_i1.p1 TRINITY_DN48278_c0_g1~~TRINITY_DN48278_c0_g1_i1.p1  ORF type:complete len:129 (-),score=3.12 TRINITY_DN48278_c0_g1_i1:70-456(-)
MNSVSSTGLRQRAVVGSSEKPLPVQNKSAPTHPRPDDPSEDVLAPAVGIIHRGELSDLPNPKREPPKPGRDRTHERRQCTFVHEEEVADDEDNEPLFGSCQRVVVCILVLNVLCLPLLIIREMMLRGS